MMYAVKHIVASGECEKYSASSMCRYVHVYYMCMLIHKGALAIHNILLVCDASMFTY